MAAVPEGVRCVEQVEMAAAVEVLAEAFDDDPVSRWLLPDRDTRHQLHRSLFRPFVEMALRSGEAQMVDDFTGVALWADVDPAADEAESTEWLERLRDELGAGPFDRFAAVHAQLEHAHPDHAPHSYLPFIGVVPVHRGFGAGTRLLRHRLDDMDRRGRAAYLTATSARSRALYERLGFRACGPALRPGGPPLLPMWREPGRTNTGPL